MFVSTVTLNYFKCSKKLITNIPKQYGTEESLIMEQEVGESPWIIITICTFKIFCHKSLLIKTLIHSLAVVMIVGLVSEVTGISGIPRQTLIVHPRAWSRQDIWHHKAGAYGHCDCEFHAVGLPPPIFPLRLCPSLFIPDNRNPHSDKSVFIHFMPPPLLKHN